MAVDKVKVQKNNIIESLVHTFDNERKSESFNFKTAAKAAVEEAFELGKKVGSGKLSEPLEEPSKKKPKPKA